MTAHSQAAVASWLEFWSADTAIYANARHKELHYAALARGIAEHAPSKIARVLDHGCGEALSAATLARRCGALFLFDASPYVRSKLVALFSDTDRIFVLHDGALCGIEDASLDLVVAASLIQYLSQAELRALLDLWRAKLKADGALLIADIPAPQSTAVADALSLLVFGLRSRFFVAALLSLARLYFSPYRRLRRDVGFSRYSAAEISALLGRHGFEARILPKNIGHDSRRLAVVAKPSGASKRQVQDFGDCAADGLALAVPSCKETR